MMKDPLEALERLKYNLLAEGYWQDVLQDVLVIEKALKALEIIKKDPTSALMYIALYKSGCEIITNGKVIKSYDEESGEEPTEHDLLQEVLL